MKGRFDDGGALVMVVLVVVQGKKCVSSYVGDCDDKVVLVTLNYVSK